MPNGTRPSPDAHDHVVEIDLIMSGKRFLVAPEDRLEHGQKGLRPEPVSRLRCPPGDVGERQLGALVVVEEGCHQTRERIDPIQFLKSVEYLVWGIGDKVTPCAASFSDRFSVSLPAAFSWLKC